VSTLSLCTGLAYLNETRGKSLSHVATEAIAMTRYNTMVYRAKIRRQDY
jgi:hypothetical protein